MDLTSDGVLDIISGSRPGELYLFRGKGKGLFGAAEVIKDARGNPVKAGDSNVVFATDWDHDRDLDLIVGTDDGAVLLVLRGKNGFGTPVKVKAAGKPIKVPDGASPCVADWDGDGRHDLVVGAFDGSVTWYRNAGSNTAPELEAGRLLIPKSTQNTGKEKAEKTPWGERAKICVVDWNEDGRLDLLLGDFSALFRPPDAKVEARRTELKKARTASLRKLLALKSERYRLREQGQQENLASLEKKIGDLQEEVRNAGEELRKLPKAKGGYTTHGHVWLFLRKGGSGAAETAVRKYEEKEPLR